MKTEHGKVQQALYQLTTQLMLGYFEFRYARYIHHARIEDRIQHSNTFFAGAEECFFNQSILVLSNLLFHDPSSISVEYFLNCVEQTPEALPAASTDDHLTDVIADHRVKLQQLKQSLRNVKELRDRTIAHLDRKWENYPWYTRPVAEYDKIDTAFAELNRILGAYNLYLQPPVNLSEDLDRIGRLVEDELNELINRLQAVNEAR